MALTIWLFASRSLQRRSREHCQRARQTAPLQPGVALSCQSPVNAMLRAGMAFPTMQNPAAWLRRLGILDGRPKTLCHADEAFFLLASPTFLVRAVRPFSPAPAIWLEGAKR